MASQTETEVTPIPTLVLHGMTEKSPFSDRKLLERLTSHNPLVPLPPAQQRDAKIAHAPKRNISALNREGKKVSNIQL